MENGIVVDGKRSKMFREDANGQILDNDGKVFEPAPIEETISFYDGLDVDSINQFIGLDVHVRKIIEGKDVKENTTLLRRQLLSYWDRMSIVRDEKYIQKIKEHPKNNPESVLKYDQIVEKYNLAVGEDPIDIEKVADILRRAFALFGCESKNL